MSVARVTHRAWHIPTEFVYKAYAPMYTVCFLYKGILNLAIKINVNYIFYTNTA